MLSARHVFSFILKYFAKSILLTTLRVIMMTAPCCVCSNMKASFSNFFFPLNVVCSDDRSTSSKFERKLHKQINAMRSLH